MPGCSTKKQKLWTGAHGASALARIQQFMRFNPAIFFDIRAVHQVMDKRKRSYWVAVYLTLDEKEAVERRAKALGMSISGFMREKAINPQRSIEEILAREWVAVALQLRKMQSESSEKQQLQEILEQLKLLIARTISR